MFVLLTMLELVLNFHTQISCGQKTLWSLVKAIRSEIRFHTNPGLSYLPSFKNLALSYTHLLSRTDFWSIWRIKRSPLRTIFLLKLLHKTNKFHVASCLFRNNMFDTTGWTYKVTIFSSYYIFMSSVIYYWTNPRQHVMYLLTLIHYTSCSVHHGYSGRREYYNTKIDYQY